MSPRNLTPAEEWRAVRIEERRRAEQQRLEERLRVRKLPPGHPDRVAWLKKGKCCGGAS